MACCGIDDGGCQRSNRKMPIVYPPKEVPACCYPVPCSSCCWNPCIPCCCPRACDQLRRPCPRPRLSMCCPPDPCCPTPCPIFKCCPAPCSSPTRRANAATSYLVPVPPPPGPSVIVRPKITCPSPSCRRHFACPPNPCDGVDPCQKLLFR